MNMAFKYCVTLPIPPITASSQKDLDEVVRVANIDYKALPVIDVINDPTRSTNLSANLSVSQPSFSPSRSYDLTFVDYINDVAAYKVPVIFSELLICSLFFNELSVRAALVPSSS